MSQILASDPQRYSGSLLPLHMSIGGVDDVLDVLVVMVGAVLLDPEHTPHVSGHRALVVSRRKGIAMLHIPIESWHPLALSWQTSAVDTGVAAVVSVVGASVDETV